MITYDGSAEHDALLLWWWDHLRKTGDLGRTFTAGLHPVGAFLTFWRIPGRVLVFEVDTKGLWFAGWTEPLLSGVLVGLWGRDDMRRSRRGFRALEAFLNDCIARWPLVLGVTKQEKLLRPHERLGYTVFGPLPGLWDGDPAWLVALTPDAWAKRMARRTT